MTQENAQKLEQLKKININIFNAVDDSLRNYQIEKVPVASLMFLSYTLSERMAFLLKSTNHFIDMFKHDARYELQIGLLLRPALLDILSFYYITEFFKIGNPKNLLDVATKRMFSYFEDNVNRYKYEINNLKKNGIIDEMRCNSIIDNIDKYFSKTNFLYDFDENVENQKDNNSSASKIFEYFAEKKDYFEVINITYNNYSYYSKYEHFGLLTIALQDPVENSFEDKIYRMYQSSIVILNCIIKALYYIEIDPSELLKIKKYIDNNGTK